MSDSGSQQNTVRQYRGSLCNLFAKDIEQLFRSVAWCRQLTCALLDWFCTPTGVAKSIKTDFPIMTSCNDAVVGKELAKKAYDIINPKSNSLKLPAG